MFKKYLVLVPLLAMGCSKGGDNRLKEKAQIESETAAKSQTEAELKAQNTRSTEMEEDLAKRHRFFQTVKGAYEGSFQTDLGDFQIRILLVPSLNPVEVDRTRLPEEVASDLNNLHFNAQIQMWSAGNPNSASGCRVDGIKPDLKNGIVNIVSANCPNTYFLAISNLEASKGLSVQQHYIQTVDKGLSAQLSKNIMVGAVQSLNEMAGYLRMTNVATTYHFRIQRVNNEK